MGTNETTSSAPIIEQPVFGAWIDARHAMSDLADKHGAAVIVPAEGGTIFHGPFRVIPAATHDECVDLAGELPILGDAP